MPTVDYLLIGHITADLKDKGRSLGGTVSYAAPTVHRFGHRVGILTSAAACEPLLVNLLPHADLCVWVGEETTTFENIYNERGRIQYVHELAASLRYDMIPQGWVQAPLVHLAPLVDEVEHDIASHFTNSTVLLTPQGYLRRWDEKGRVYFKRWLDADVLGAADIVILSKQDIADAPDLEIEFSRVTKHLIVTDGERGGVYYHNGDSMVYPPYPVKEVEPTGAGDIFAASLLSSLPLLNHDMQAAVQVAARLAGLSVTRVGVENAILAQEVQQALTDARS